jgi:acyl transferase domain-containing protein
MGHHSSTYGAYTDTQLAMDARAFGISRKESIEMNPQMILILEVSSAAISAALTTSRVHL